MGWGWSAALPAAPPVLSPPGVATPKGTTPAATTAAAVQKIVRQFDEGVAPRSWKYIVLHHSASTSGSVESIHEAHRQRYDAAGQPWRGIGYHFVIGNGDGMGDGEIASTFRWREQSDGAHAGVATFNQFGVGICLIGDFQSQPPTPAQLAALGRLIDVLRREYGIDDDRLLTHRELKPTACPGEHFPLSRIRPARPAGRPAPSGGE